MITNVTNNEKIDVLRSFDYALPDEEIEFVLEHDMLEHENGAHPNCPACQNDTVDVIH